jgi:hypothetical protein
LNLKTTAELRITDGGRFFLTIVINGAKSVYAGYLRDLGENNITVVGVNGPLVDPPAATHPANGWSGWVSDTSVSLRLPSGAEYVFGRVKTPNKSPNSKKLPITGKPGK